MTERLKTPNRRVCSVGGEGDRRCAKRLLMLSATGAKCVVVGARLQSWKPSVPLALRAQWLRERHAAEREGGCLKQRCSTTVLRHTSVPGEDVRRTLRKTIKFHFIGFKTLQFHGWEAVLEKEWRVYSAPSVPPRRSALCATTQCPRQKCHFIISIKYCKGPFQMKKKNVPKLK